VSIVDPKSYYKGFNIDFDSNMIAVNLIDPGENVSIYDIWADAFSEFNEVNVCLSGGIDSQFVCSVLKQLNKDLTVYIFSFIWDDCVFNSPDVVHAIRFCERFGYQYNQIEIDYKKLLESGEFLKTCMNYKANSPQIALQLKMLDYIDNKNPTFLGGDVPMMDYNFKTKQANTIGVAYLPVITQPFLNYALANERIIIKDILRVTPESHFLAYKHFLDITVKHKLVCSSEQAGAGQTQPVRTLFYTGLVSNIIPPLLKNTGFEILKTHLAKQTGIYNEYDIQYRFPLEEILKREDWYYDKQFKLLFNTELEHIKNSFENFCQNETKLKAVELYNFIL